MNMLLPAFQWVSVIFACASIATGLQAVVGPVSFSHSFGLPITTVRDADKSTSTAVSPFNMPNGNPITSSWVSLMGIRQFATGITILTFAYEDKWTEIATILAILGIVVAGTDGFFLSRSGAHYQGKLHVIPGALIAILAGAVVLTTDA